MIRRNPPGFGPAVLRPAKVEALRLEPAIREPTSPGSVNPDGPRPGRQAGSRKGGLVARLRTGWKWPNQGLIITLVVSFGLHAAAVTAALLLLHAGVPVVDAPDKPTEVELVMEERKGALGPTDNASVTPPAPPAPPEARPIPEDHKPAEAKAASPPVQPLTDAPAAPPAAATSSAEAPPGPVQAAATPVEAEPDTSEATAMPVEAQPDTSEATAVPVEAQSDTPEHTAVPPRQSEPSPATSDSAAQSAKPEPAPPPTRPAPTISLAGTDSPSDAKSFGDRIIPAAPDAVFHNRPPVYPQESALNGEHGTVVVVIHVSPAGTAAGVDLLRSSGYVLLDRAARDAVLRWRFLPAVKDGQPVASDMTMGFEFDNE